jgi:hypothetical protein
MNEEQIYERIFSRLLMDGEYKEEDIDELVHEIMDKPLLYPKFFDNDDSWFTDPMSKASYHHY